jgi:hypothetical protein
MSNFQLGDTEQVPYQLTALDADSNPAVAQPGDVTTVVSSAPASISVVPDATPAVGTIASGQLVGGSTLATGVSITATVTHTDGTSATVTDLIDVVGGEATSLSISLGTPTQQPAPAGTTANAALKPAAAVKKT